MKKIFKFITIFSIILAVMVIGLYTGYFYTNSEGELLTSNILKSRKDTVALDKPLIVDKAEKEEIVKEEVIKETTKIVYNYKNVENDTVMEEVKSPTKAMIGLNEDILNKTFDEFKIVEFSEETVILEKTVIDPTLYIVGNSNGHVAVYYFDEKNEKKLKQETLTLISTLPAHDQKLINTGIKVNDETQLLSILDDYEN